MVKLRPRCFSKPDTKLDCCGGRGGAMDVNSGGGGGDIKWELRPGGLLVQRRENGGRYGEGMIRLRASTVSDSHDISIQATSTFGELKIILSLVTGLEPQEQRLLYRGKERDDDEFLHMVGVKDMDKVLVLQDPAKKEGKLHALTRNQTVGNCQVITA